MKNIMENTQSKDTEFVTKVKAEAALLREKIIRDYKNRDNLTKDEEYFLTTLEEQDFQCHPDKEKMILRDNYYKIVKIIDYYLDLRPEYQNLVALWIIGTYMHSDFDSFPYLFINAMRGSGKSRLLRLISVLANEGRVLNSLTEAVLFRTQGTLAIDEFEGVGSKDKQSLRELLNSGYKKGTKVLRMKQKKTMNGTEQIVEEFEVYRPILMANIWGMDEVLGDRCVSIILEKSNDASKVKLVEDFENNEIIQLLKLRFLSLKCSLCSVVTVKNVYKDWNNYVKNKNNNYIYTHITLTTLTTHTTQELLDSIALNSFFNKVDESNIYGRNLEIFLPIFIIAKLIGDEVLINTLKTSSEMVFEKRHDEEMESIDVQVYDFISKQANSLDFSSIQDLRKMFQQFANISDEWMNDKWFGRALKRLNLVVSKRRRSNGIEVILNIPKAIEKVKIFKTGDKI